MYCSIFQNEFSIEQALNHNDRIILHRDLKIFPKYWPTVLWLAYDSLYDFVHDFVCDSVYDSADDSVCCLNAAKLILLIIHWLCWTEKTLIKTNW